jgi:hypothetical protein
MRPSAPLLALILIALAATLPALCSIDFEGASPRRAFMQPARNVLRLIVSRKPVPYCSFPEREDALNFLGAYVLETLECGHRVEQFFNPPVESLIAKRRRCAKCLPELIEFPARDVPLRKAA